MKRVLFLALLLGASSGVAQPQPAVSAAPSAQKSNGDRVICETIEEIGSRLAAKRVCMTQKQWEEQRRLDREELEDKLRHETNPNSR